MRRVQNDYMIMYLTEKHGQLVKNTSLDYPAWQLSFAGPLKEAAQELELHAMKSHCNHALKAQEIELSNERHSPVANRKIRRDKDLEQFQREVIYLCGLPETIKIVDDEYTMIHENKSLKTDDTPSSNDVFTTLQPLVTNLIDNARNSVAVQSLGSDTLPLVINHWNTSLSPVGNYKQKKRIKSMNTPGKRNKSATDQEVGRVPHICERISERFITDKTNNVTDVDILMSCVSCRIGNRGKYPKVDGIANDSLITKFMLRCPFCLLIIDDLPRCLYIWGGLYPYIVFTIVAFVAVAYPLFSLEICSGQTALQFTYEAITSKELKTMRRIKGKSKKICSPTPISRTSTTKDTNARRRDGHSSIPSEEDDEDESLSPFYDDDSFGCKGNDREPEVEFINHRSTCPKFCSRNIPGSNYLPGGVLTGVDTFPRIFNTMFGRNTTQARMSILLVYTILLHKILIAFIFIFGEIRQLALYNEAFATFGEPNVIPVYVQENCSFLNISKRPTENDVSTALCFSFGIAGCDNSYYWSNLSINGSPDRYSMMSPLSMLSMKSEGVLIENKETTLDYCPELFEPWNWSTTSFVHRSQGLVPLCYTIREDPNPTAGWVPYEADLDCLCSMLSPDRCVSSQICFYDWQLQICRLSAYQIYIERELLLYNIGYRKGFLEHENLKSRSVRLTDNTKECPEVLGPSDDNCDVVDMAARRRLPVFDIGTCFGYFMLILINGLLVRRFKFFSYSLFVLSMTVPVFWHVFTGPTTTFGLSGELWTEDSDKIPIHNRLDFSDKCYIDSDFATTHRYQMGTDGRGAPLGPQGYIVQTSLDETRIEPICTIGPGQNVDMTLSTAGYPRRSFLEDLSLYVSTISQALMYSNIGTGINLHHGTILAKQSPLGIHYLAPVIVQLSLYNTNLLSMAAGAIQLIGTNVYPSTPSAGLNQRWWLSLADSMNFNPFLETIWGSGVYAVLLLIQGPYALCGQQDQQKLAIDKFSAFIWIIGKLIVYMNEYYILTSHFMMTFFPPKLSFTNIQIDHGYRSILVYIVFSCLIFFFTVVPTYVFSDPSLSKSISKWFFFNTCRFFIPCYAIVFCYGTFWRRERSLVAFAVGRTSLIIKEITYWGALLIMTIVPLITFAVLPDGSLECREHYFTCQPFHAFPSSLTSAEARMEPFRCYASWWLLWTIYGLFWLLQFSVWFILTLLGPEIVTRNTDMRKNKQTISHLVSLSATSPRVDPNHSLKLVNRTLVGRDALSPIELYQLKNMGTQTVRKWGLPIFGLHLRFWWLIIAQGRLGGIYTDRLAESSSLVKRPGIQFEGMTQQVVVSDFWNFANFTSFLKMYMAPFLMVCIIQYSIIELMHVKIPWLTRKIYNQSEFTTTEQVLYTISMAIVPVVLVLCIYFYIIEFYLQRKQQKILSNHASNSDFAN
eukprot:GHVH01016205.1.p1 GENE.GHVH01016205.1~~GHVH01016205.1.p1  ORF type:complete len:1517 (+),score=155.52 GHVH01016205.1:309-4553(+)